MKNAQNVLKTSHRVEFVVHIFLCYNAIKPGSKDILLSQFARVMYFFYCFFVCVCLFVCGVAVRMCLSFVCAKNKNATVTHTHTNTVCADKTENATKGVDHTNTSFTNINNTIRQIARKRFLVSQFFLFLFFFLVFYECVFFLSETIDPHYHINITQKQKGGLQSDLNMPQQLCCKHGGVKDLDIGKEFLTLLNLEKIKRKKPNYAYGESFNEPGTNISNASKLLYELNTSRNNTTMHKENIDTLNNDIDLLPPIALKSNNNSNHQTQQEHQQYESSTNSTITIILSLGCSLLGITLVAYIIYQNKNKNEKQKQDNKVQNSIKSPHLSGTSC